MDNVRVTATAGFRGQKAEVGSSTLSMEEASCTFYFHDFCQKLDVHHDGTLTKVIKIPSHHHLKISALFHMSGIASKLSF